MIIYSDELDQTIAQRLDVLNDEVARLTEARRILVGEHLAPQRQSTRKSPTTGDNGDRALELIRQQPGITAGRLGPALGMAPLSGYAIANRLRDKGLVTKREGGWHAT